MHTLELNAGTVDTAAGPHLRAGWTWAPSALEDAQVSRLSRLWFDALAGICAHVRCGGGGFTPSDIAAGLSQQQIDELQRQYRIADVLPLTPLQQGLLFHASTAQGSDDVYAVQLDITLSGWLDQHRLRDAVHTVATRHPVSTSSSTFTHWAAFDPVGSLLQESPQDLPLLNSAQASVLMLGLIAD